MTDNKPIVVGLGEVLWDVFSQQKRPGGAPANVAYHAARLGAQAFLVSAVGADADGQELLAQLQMHHIACCTARVPYPTGRVEVTLHNGAATYRIVENSAWDHIPFTQEAAQLMAQSDAACFGTLAFRSPDTAHTLRQLLDQMRPQALKVLDVNLRPPYYSAELLQDLLGRCNALKLNDEEAPILAPLAGAAADPADVCRGLLARYGLRLVILTAGARYSEIYTPAGVSRLPTPVVKVADTVGAGDSFTGAFITAFLQGQTLEQAHRQAVQTAAYVCTRPGAWPE